MLIAGFQPVSLVDYPGVVCSIVFTQGCPFRCPFCHNPSLVSPTGVNRIEEEAIFTHLQTHSKMIEGVCVTGGEPTAQPDLVEFLKKLKDRRVLVKIDTNGANPAMLKNIFEQKLADYVAMDLKHVWSRYAEATGRTSPQIAETCKTSFAMIESSGVPHEFRTTVVGGMQEVGDLMEIARGIGQGGQYILQPVRYGVTLDPSLPRHEAVDIQSAMEMIREERPDLKVEIRG